MRILILITAFFFCRIAANCQVHVRGYYRSNGTYVAPHERTRPNNTITDNYSYPGNYNPNKGQGRSYDINPSDYTPPEYYSASEGSKISFEGKKEIYIKAEAARLRASPSTDGDVICTLKYRQSVFFIGDEGDGWKKVLYKYYNGEKLQLPRYVVGYIKLNLLSSYYPARKKRYTYVSGRKYEMPDMDGMDFLFSGVGENADAVDSYLRRKFEHHNETSSVGHTINDGNCLFTTNFDSPTISVPLRSAPSIDAALIYSCPKNSVVCIIDRNDPIFYRVKIDDRIGYISKGFLIRK